MKKLNAVIVLMLISAIILKAQNPAIQTQIQNLEQQLKLTPTNAKIHLNLGKLHYKLVMSGEKKYLKIAIGYLKKAIKLDPKNSTIHCWYGSAIVMKAKYSKIPPMKAYYVIAGLEEMDKAIELEANNIENRFIRGQTCLGIPSFFNRTNTAIEDFNKLEQLVKYAPKKFDNDTKAKILYYLGKSYKANGDSKKSQEYFDNMKHDYADTDFVTNLK